MVEIVNLRQVRKRKARDARGHAADENRARFGRSKADVMLERAQRALDDARHEAHGPEAQRRDETPRRDQDDDG